MSLTEPGFLVSKVLLVPNAQGKQAVVGEERTSLTEGFCTEVV